MKSIKNISEFARRHNVTRQAIQNRIKAGYKFGILDGEEVMYNPESVHKVAKHG